MKAFYLTEKPDKKNWYILTNNFDKMEMPKISTSYQKLAAALIDLDYEGYLNFCSESLGAQVIKRPKAKYATVLFPKSEIVNFFVDILNRKFEESYVLHKEY